MSNATPNPSFEVLESSEAQRRLTLRHRWALMGLVGVNALIMLTFLPARWDVTIILLFLALAHLRLTSLSWAIGYVVAVSVFRFTDQEFLSVAGYVDHGFYSFFAVTFLAVSCRYAEVVRYATAYNVDERPQPQHKSLLELFPTIFSSLWYQVFFAMITAMTILIINPESPMMPSDFGLKTEWGRLIFLMMAIFSLWIIVRFIIGTIARFRLTPEVAELNSRALANSEFWSELAGVESRSAKLNKSIRNN